MRIVIRDLNNPEILRLEDVEGHRPMNYVCEAPEGLETSEAHLIDLVEENGEIKAVINEDRRMN